MTDGKKGREEENTPSVKTTIEVPRELWKKLKIRALQEDYGKGLSAMVTEILRKYLEEEGK